MNNKQDTNLILDRLEIMQGRLSGHEEIKRLIADSAEHIKKQQAIIDKMKG